MQKSSAIKNDELTQYKLLIEGVSQPLYGSACQTLLEIMSGGGIFLEANCGGRGSCGKCKIRVLDGQVKGPDGLPAEPLQDNIYLACQIYPASNITISVKHSEASAKGNVATFFTPDGSPLVKKNVVKPVYPAADAHYSLQELLDQLLPTAGGFLDTIAVLKQFAQVLAAGSEQMTVVTINDKIVAVEAGDTAGILYGLAFDIGTTTVVGMLVDINDYKVVATFSETNPQAAFGADVISRIDAAKTDAGLAAQATAIRQCLDRITGELCIAATVPRQQIYAAAIVGNSTMLHLLLAIPPVSLTRQPYAAVFKIVPPFAASEIELMINLSGKVILLPGIASFIGADTTAAILATGQDISLNQSLMVDLGTNGEIALGNQEQIFACSTAAGPAFEGSHIRSGMRASIGAIEDIVIDEDVQLATIGGGKPVGICGSGIIKAIAQLLQKKIITASGRFNHSIIESLPPKLARRLINQDGQWEFVLVAANDSITSGNISITQSDIRQIQLVKSAICTGIKMLMDKAAPESGIPVFLAGAFGNYIDIESALTIGLLPGFMPEQVRSVGNAAGTGAVCVLLSQNKLARCLHIVNEINYVELAADPNFQKQFLANLNFPEVIR